MSKKQHNIIQNILIKTVKTYQLILSPDHSLWAKSRNNTPYCKHIPTCSEYMIESIEKKWAIIGSFKWILRISRCMPWNKWWYDPVEKVKK
jgi:hypothetical protein